MIRAVREKRQPFRATAMVIARWRRRWWAMPSAYQIVVNTPLWVWPLMLFVLWLGWRGLRPRTMPPARLAILPLVGLATSLAGIAQSLQPGLAFAGWAVALLAALPLGWAIGTAPLGALATRGRPAGSGRRLVRPGLRHLDLRRALHARRPVRRHAAPARRAALDRPVGRRRRHRHRHRIGLARQPAAARLSPAVDEGSHAR